MTALEVQFSKKELYKSRNWVFWVENPCIHLTSQTVQDSDETCADDFKFS